MKKTARIVLALIFVFGMVLASAPHQAQAKEIITNSDIAGGSWTAGSSVDVTTLAASAPNWLQLLSADGVKLTGAGKICHPLRGGRFGWVGQIMQYKNGSWVKLATTNDWVPNKEGEFMSCAQAPTAGTFALFGYFIQPAAVAQDNTIPCTYDTSTWTSELFWDGSNFHLGVNFGSPVDSGVNAGVTVNYLVTSVIGNVSLINSGSTTSTEIEGPDDIRARFSQTLTHDSGSWWVYYTVTVGGCSKALEVSYT